MDIYDVSFIISTLWIARLSIFFGVMLVSVGLGIFAIRNFLKK